MIKFEPRKWSVEQRILAVLAYFDIFDLALSVEEITNLMLGEKVELKVVEASLKKMAGQVESDGILYALKEREVILSKRMEKRHQAEILKKKVRKYAWLYSWVPFVRGVAVCNYLSVGAVDEDSDIDLLVISAPGRIFLARVFLTIWMHLLGVRRHHGKISGRFCLSFYVSDSALGFEKILEKPYDIYFIYWLMALWPIYGEKGLWTEVEKSNSWMSEGRAWKIGIREVKVGKNWFARIAEFLLSGWLGGILENVLKKYFTRKHQKRIGSLPLTASVIVSEEMLKYHNNDRRTFFREKFEENLKMRGFSD